MYLRQSTAQAIRFGPFLDSTDGVTPETGLTIAQADMRISKDGQNYVQTTETSSATHDEAGWYSTGLTSGDTDTAGIMKLQVAVAGAIPVWETYFVLTATAYDALQTGTFNNLGGTAQTADHTAGIAAIPTTAMRGTDSAALATVCTETRLAELDAGNLPTDIAAIPTTAMRGTDSAALATVCTETRLAELDSGNLPTDIAAIPTTAMRGTDGANTTTPPTAVQNRQEMDSNSTQLTAIVLDTGTTIPAQINSFTIPKNASYSNFPFLMVLTSDGRTPAIGLTVTGQRRLDNGSFTSVTGTISEVSNGIYEFDAQAADTNGDIIVWRFSSATADDTFERLQTT